MLLYNQLDVLNEGPINMEVGIEELLNINIWIKNKAFYLDGLIEGEIFFKNVKL